MDSGSYNNVRRGANPLSPTSQSAASYKTNVNRTKTRKWVEAKTQNYDGDDWGNDFDDDDNDSQQDEPEPAPPLPTLTSRTTGLRQVGQTANHNLPSTRVFSQPAAAAASTPQHMSGASAMRSPSGPPALHVQTQPTTTGSPAPVTHSAHPGMAPAAPSSLQTSLPPVAQSAGPATNSTRFPPRKSSMGQQDRPAGFGNPRVSGYDAQPASSSGNDVSTSPPPSQPNKALPFVRPSDIYKRMEEEKEKERLSMDSSRPSMDSVPSRSEGRASPNLTRTAGEQRGRTNFDSHDDPESTRGARPTPLASVAERKSEYGMEGLLAKEQAGKSAASSELPQLSPEMVDEGTKDDLEKSRRYSTSPQLPSLSRLSGFGGDWFSSSNESRAASGSPFAPPPAEKKIEEEPSKPDEEYDGPKEKLQSSARPSLPGTWVSETTTIHSEEPTPVDTRNTVGPTPLAQVDNASSATDSDEEASAAQPVAKTLSSTSEASAESASGAVDGDGRHVDGGAIAESGTSTPDRSLPHLQTDNPAQSTRPRSTILSPAHQTPVSSAAQSGTTPESSEFSSIAPLDPRRASTIQQDIVLPSQRPQQQRKSTLSTIDTAASPDKESDLLREEIIKSLSPAPLSAGGSSGGNPSQYNHPGTDPSPGNLTRESTYLSDVYDDYLYTPEEKSLVDVSRAAKQSAMGSSGHLPQQPVDDPMAQTKPLSPSKNPAISLNTDRPRRFSWEQGEEEVTFSPAVTDAPAPSFAPEPQDQQSAASAAPGSLQADRSGPRPMQHHVSDVSSRGPADSLATIDTPSPVSQITAKSPVLADQDQDKARLSFAEEKENFITDIKRSPTPSEQHPALSQSPSRESEPNAAAAPSPTGNIGAPADVLSPAQQQSAPMGFRDILKLDSREQRIQKFEETCEQFYATDTGLSSWIASMQAQADDVGPVTAPAGKAGVPSSGAASPGLAQQQLPYYQQMINASRTPSLTSQPRRTSMGNVQQLMAGQSSSFSTSGNQVGTKSKELLHAAGVFGGKGVKSGMKLFNKGKSKLRERTGGA